jgi:hypothetical protein
VAGDGVTELPPVVDAAWLAEHLDELPVPPSVEADQRADGGDQRDREQNGARYRARGVAHLPAQEADVVVAPVVVDRDQERRPEACEKLRPECESALGEVEGQRGVEVQYARGDDPHERQHHAGPKVACQSFDDGDLSVEQKCREQTDAAGDERAERHLKARVRVADQRQGDVHLRGGHRLAERGEGVGGVHREADAAGGDRERGAEGELPDEEEGD